MIRHRRPQGTRDRRQDPHPPRDEEAAGDPAHQERLPPTGRPTTRTPRQSRRAPRATPPHRSTHHPHPTPKPARTKSDSPPPVDPPPAPHAKAGAHQERLPPTGR